MMFIHVRRQFLVRHVQRLGIRQQLVLAYTTVFMLLMMSSGLLAYKYLEHTLAASFDTTLALREDQYAQEITFQNQKIVIHNVLNELQNMRSDADDPHSVTIDIQSNAMERILDMHGNVMYASPAFQILHPPADSFIQPLHGRPWTGTVHTGAIDQEVRIYSEALLDHGTAYAVVQVGESLNPLHLILRQQVTILLILAFILVLFSALGSFWLAGLAFAPIHNLISTARKIQESNLSQRVPVPVAHDEVYALATTLNEMIERLDKAFTRQRRFVADASHELRTPVAAIRSKSDVALLAPRTQAEYQAILQQINTESEHLGILISDLLALARADEDQAHLEYEPVQLDYLIAEVVANAEILAQERGIALLIEHNEPIVVQGDETRLIQVVMNLLDNALTYTQSGGCVRVALTQDEQGVHISVSDTGEGIAQEHLSSIFERFYRVDPARTRREGNNSGLGLSIVDWVIRAHGGHIAVQSRPGQGSTFIITLPIS